MKATYEINLFMSLYTMKKNIIYNKFEIIFILYNITMLQFTLFFLFFINGNSPIFASVIYKIKFIQN